MSRTGKRFTIMCKKLLLTGVALFVGFALLRSTSLGSLVQVAWKDARTGLDRAVPPDVQIKQLQVEIDKVDQDIRKNLGVLASQEVEHQGLEENVAGLKELLGKLKSDIAGMTTSLETRTVKPVAGRDPLAAKLDAAVATYENKKIELKGKEQLLAAKKQALEAAHQRIGEMRDQKERLRVTAAKLETRLEVVRLKEVQNKVEIDDSQVNRCNTLANKIEARLREKEKVAELNLQYGYRSEAPILDKEPRPAAEVLKAAKKALAEEGENVVGVEAK